MTPSKYIVGLNDDRALSRPPRREPAHILLVDDDDTLRTIIQLGLERLGYAVSSAENGEAALEKAAQSKEFQLLITDVLMPGLSGVQLAEKIRKLHPRLEVLYVSGHLRSTLSMIDVPFDSIHFLQKPFRSTQLDDRIQTILSNRTEL